jgi:hypothetical protein
MGFPEGGEYCWEFWQNTKNVCIKHGTGNALNSFMLPMNLPLLLA